MQEQITNIKKLNKIANNIRQNIITMLLKAGSGHSAGSLGLADVFTALYFNVLKHDPKRPNWQERDRVILSNGHICPVWYATLAQAGYFPKRELWTLRQLGSPLQGHPRYHSAPGIENTSGPLGQGISVAAGLAYAIHELQKSHENVFCVTSDGEHDEGQTWEAVMFAAKHKLPNLTVIIDRNNIQISGQTEQVMPLDSLKDKYQAFNWHVIEIDGHNMEEIIAALNKAKSIVERPVCVIANTIPGKGVDFMEYNYEWHGKAPNTEEAERALRQLSNLSSRTSV
ncbi:MAG: transketolase [Candidatus Komeilibacteria bacterium RIFCSPLOWO2_02_FULL_48_11]|uniref:Transketolase n=1 Tax=Candidatus Komeilibacteria bacterium RIFCSPLOWO2_02_FULL_48_11 TaxID=1798553 RepID=A0A1G2BU61_9BACT|nr:MAG: transketolase [Candidatus Komeilibacteria bacterium RIFCSPLOWO2_02_FULL_48_11]